ncbi:MBL fold metallo-hydrolase [Streptomyces malaysiensis]|uniref:MBL fold metallo-hydrolase n=1 Tax=Streptomyces malaysiensis TaxID=92644 RepID=UPI0036CF5DBA
MVNTMFLVTRKGVVLVDAPLDLGETLLAGIEEVTPKPITHLIYSHAHADHIGAAHLLARDNLKIISHELTGRFMQEAHDDKRPLPNETFTGRRNELNIDGQRIILEYTGDWHQPGNLFIHLPEQKVLTAIDSFTVRNAPFFRLLFTPRVPAYFGAMDQMLDYDFETVVSGHMALFGTPEDVQTNREYLHDLRTAATEALREVDMREAAAAAGVPENNQQARLKVWIDAVVARATELMPASWDKRLGGNDIFLPDNLNTVAWSVFMD